MENSTHGITFQVKTPIYRMNNLGDERQDRYVQEFFAAYPVTKNMQFTGFYNGNFRDEIHQVAVGITIFL